MNMSMKTPSFSRVLIICPFSGLRRFEFFTFRLLFAVIFYRSGTTAWSAVEDLTYGRALQ